MKYLLFAFCFFSVAVFGQVDTLTAEQKARLAIEKIADNKTRKITANMIGEALEKTLETSVSNEGSTGLVNSTFFYAKNSWKTIYIAVDPINGIDSLPPEKYSIGHEWGLDSTKFEQKFRSLQGALEFANNSSYQDVIIELYNTSQVIPAKTYSTVFLYGGKNIVLNGGYPGNKHIQLDGTIAIGPGNYLGIQNINIDSPTSSKLNVQGGYLYIGACSVNPRDNVTQIFAAPMGNVHLDKSIVNFSRNGQILIGLAGNYGVKVIFGVHGPMTWNTQGYTGISLFSSTHQKYGFLVSYHPDNINLPADINADGGLWIGGNTMSIGVPTWSANNNNYRAVLGGSTPLKFDQLNSTSADQAGTLKMLVVDENGVVGVKTITP